MPLLSGLEALRRIRADERFRELPVIILSGDHIFKIIVEELNATLVSKGENNLLRILDAALKNVVKVHARNRPA
jgi:CheY-like chemotaxis protein